MKKYQSLPVGDVAEDVAVEDAAGPPAAPEPDLDAVAAEAGKLNNDLAAWVYQLPKFKYDQFAKRTDDLLKDSQ